MTNRLTTAHLIDWLKPQITTGADVIPARIPSGPNRIISVFMVDGSGSQFEGTFDVVGIQITCRGAEHNLSDTEKIANQVDDVFINAAENFQLGPDGNSVWVNEIGRVGSPPVAAPIPSDQSRWTATCTYYIKCSNNLGG